MAPALGSKAAPCPQHGTLHGKGWGAWGTEALVDSTTPAVSTPGWHRLCSRTDSGQDITAQGCDSRGSWHLACTQ